MNKFRKISAVVCGMVFLFSGCGTSAETLTTYHIDETVDNAFFKETEPLQETTDPETTEETFLLEKLYGLDTEITDNDGEILVNMINGEKIYSEEGMLYMSGILKEIAENSVIAPKITFTTRLDSSLTKLCYEALEEGVNGKPVDGCVVVSDFDNNIIAVANHTSDIAYFKDCQLLIEDGDKRLELQKSISKNNQHICSEYYNPDEYIIIHERPQTISPQTGEWEWTDEGTKYFLDDLVQVHSNSSYHSNGDYIGSTAKIMASVVMLDNAGNGKFPSSSGGECNYVYYDADSGDFRLNSGSEFDTYYDYLHDNQKRTFPYPWKVQNFTVYNGSLCLLGNTSNAFSLSYNTFFARAYLELGLDTVTETLNRYFGLNMFGNSVSGYYFPSDWEMFEQPDLSYIEKDALDPAYTLARMAYGSAGCVSKSLLEKYSQTMSAVDARSNSSINYFRISPLYLNSIVSCIASGKFHMPSIKTDTLPLTLQEAYEQDKKLYQIEETEETVKIQNLPESIRENMWNLMRLTAKQGHSEFASRESNQGLDYRYYIKTGTADYDVDKKALILTGFITSDEMNENPEGYCITVFAKNGYELGGTSAFGATLKNIYFSVSDALME